MSKISSDLSQKPNTYSLGNTKFFILRDAVFLKKGNHKQFPWEVTSFKAQENLLLLFLFGENSQLKEIYFDLRDSFFRVTKKGEKQSTNEMIVAFHLPLYDTRDNIYCQIACVHRARVVLESKQARF